MNKGSGIYFHPTGDSVMSTFAKTMMSVQNSVGSEEHVLAFILDYFSQLAQKQYDEAEDKTGLTKPEKLSAKLDYDKDALNLPEDFDTLMIKMLAKKDTFSLIVGEDLYTHKNAENIARLVGLIDRYTMFSVLIIPSQTNTLGVSLICELDEKVGSKTLGYNEEGDFVLSALGDGDLDIPALNQQEGTFTNLDKRVVPTNAALSYSGYVLNDVANALGLRAEQTIDYTTQFPKAKGFEPLEFDLMPNFYDNGGNELRGYILQNATTKAEDNLEKLAKVEKTDGTVAYKSNPINQFNYFTNKAHQLKTAGAVYVSSEFLEANSFAEGDEVEVKSDSGAVNAKLELDTQLTGEIIYLGTFDKALDCASVFDGSRFSTVTIRKV
jgi:NADH-quinone oxidoreductase subunit G